MGKTKTHQLIQVVQRARKDKRSKFKSLLFSSVFLVLIALISCSFVFHTSEPAQAAGSTYYVSPSGSNTSPYDTWAKAANLATTAIVAGNTNVGGSGPHTMYIAPGTYNDSLTPSNANWTNAKI